ncbi:MAG: VOC family protein [Chloroflexi bacterium]|nr:VOC family protein [Chloroflexota bacterium]MDA1239523.1 VOC family protein [Chloroflexota bacterium]MQC25352.1 VOC family protein [Chloroflexota bacterium]MQC47606.1 VOC family protein [Chloroflexota bacterium]
MSRPSLVPELIVSDLDRTIAFYCDVLRFEIAYSRPEERFAYFAHGNAHLMVEQPVGRSFLVGPLEHPYGRGINIQIEVPDVAALYAAVNAAAAPIHLPIEDKWYRRDEVLLGNRQFVVQDPDGYLMRLFESLGEKPV